MKKWMIAGLMALLLVGCSEDTTTEERPKEEPKQEETKPAEEPKEEANVQAEVTEKVFYKWNDESVGGMEQVATYAEITNTGTLPIDVFDAHVTYLDSKGNVIGTTQANSMYQQIYPSVIAPGEVAYMKVTDDGGDNFADLKDVDVKVNPIEMPADIEPLDNEKVNVMKTDDWGGSVSVTGFVKNDMDKEANAVQIAAALYDKAKKFIGAFVPGSDQQFNINPGGETSFEITGAFPAEEVKNVDSAEVISSYVEYTE